MKIYKITLYVSFVIFIFFALLSVGLIFLNDNKWVTFVIDWCVGIACSIAVVFITTMIQFKVEQKKAIRKLGSSIQRLLFFNDLKGDIFALSNESEIPKRHIESFEQEWKNKINEKIKAIWESSSELTFLFRQKGYKTYLSIIKQTFSISSLFYDKESIKEIYFSIQEPIYKLAKLVLELKINEYDKKDIQEYISAYEKEHNS